MFKRLVVLCLCVLLLPARVAAQHQGVIHLAEAWVEGQTVLLGHIASFEGDAELRSTGGGKCRSRPAWDKPPTAGQIEVRPGKGSTQDVEITGLQK